jgi:hypothetical protein
MSSDVCRLIMGEVAAAKMNAILGEERVIQPIEKLPRLDTGMATMTANARTKELELLADLIDRFYPSYRIRFEELRRELVPIA